MSSFAWQIEIIILNLYYTHLRQNILFCVSPCSSSRASQRMKHKWPSSLLSLQLLMVYGFSNKCCLQTCITRRNIRKWLFMNELIDSTADGLSVWCIRPRTRSRPMFSQRKVMCAWVCLCEVPQHARGAFTRAKTLLWLQNDKSMQGIFSTNGINCPHPPPPFLELTLGAAEVRSDAHTTCNHLP